MNKKLHTKICVVHKFLLLEEVVFQHVERDATMMYDDVERSLFIVFLRHELRVGADEERVQRRLMALVRSTFAERSRRAC